MNPYVDLLEQTIKTQTAYGSLRWLARSDSDQDSTALVVVEVTFTPGNGHPFHYHPEQDEVIYVLEGSVRQWVDQDLHLLKAGDAVFVPRGTVHGSMNRSNADARVLVIRAKPQSATQPDAIDVQHDAPWNTMQP
jgi:quercetin dioxygenase-like cupin family protein